MSDAFSGGALGGVSVSRETLARLEAYEVLLRKWNPAINLVSPRSLDELWSRHIVDSAQLFALIRPQAGVWADLGSGGGFPALVVAALARELAPALEVILVESDRRKSAFLMTVIRELDLKARVIAERIETVAPLGADFLSARALAPLSMLLTFSERHLARGGICVFPKGESWRDELAEVDKSWSFELECHPSETDSAAQILILKGVTRA